MLQISLQSYYGFGSESCSHEYSSSYSSANGSGEVVEVLEMGSYYCSPLKEVLNPEYSDSHLLAVSEISQPEESLVSKLLRWLTASAILGKISANSRKLNDAKFVERSSLYTLQSWLEFPEKGLGENVGYGREDVLAASVIYLLQQLNFSHHLLSSAVSALSLLLLSGSSTDLKSFAEVWTSLPSLCAKIHWPVEANPAWRWSYHQACTDLTVELSDVEKLGEIHACERLLVVASNTLLEKSG